MDSDSARYSPAPKNASIDTATDLRRTQLQHADEAVHLQLSQGVQLHVKPPAPLTISGRVLVATFLLPYEASIDLEKDRSWVRIVGY
jgi:hypothetical protein